MIENEGLEEDTSIDEVLLPNLPQPGSYNNTENNIGSGTLTERPSNEILPLDSSQNRSNRAGGNLRTKKSSQVKVPYLHVGMEERQKLLVEQEASNKFHKFVGGNLILKQGITTSLISIFLDHYELGRK